MNIVINALRVIVLLKHHLSGIHHLVKDHITETNTSNKKGHMFKKKKWIIHSASMCGRLTLAS